MLAVMLVIWAALAEFTIVSPLYLPRPLDVVTAAREALFVGAAVTTVRAVTGFLIGVGVAYALHFLSYSMGFVKTLDAQFAASRAVPVIALLPLFLLWFGFGEVGRITIVSLASCLYVLAPLHGAFEASPREWTQLRAKLELSAYTYYRRVVVPGTLTQLLGAYRIAFAIAFTMAIAADYIGAIHGLGKFIDTARVTFNIPALFLAIIVASVIGLAVDKLIICLHRRFVHWSGKTVKA